MGTPQQFDLASIATMRIAIKNAAATAAGTGDATTVSGITLDRASFGAAGMPLTAMFAVNLAATMASGNTLSVGMQLRHSADGTTWSDYATVASTVYTTGISGGGAVYGQAVMGVSLRSAKRYLAFCATPDLSAAGTDTAVITGTAVFSGFDEPPAIA